MGRLIIKFGLMFRDFDDGKTKYDSPQAKVDEFIKLTGVEPDVFEGKVNTKSLGPAIDGFKVVVIKP